jgi:hypothetical protein
MLRVEQEALFVMRHDGSITNLKNFFMASQYEDLIKKAYNAFNARDIDTALSTMHPDVQWPKAFEGGYVSGHIEIREYWTKQWTEINPNVQPVGFNERQDGTLEITVHQKVKDLQGNTIFDGIVKHIYTLQGGLLRRMDIELE